MASAAAKKAAAANQARRASLRGFLWVAATGAGIPVWEPPSAIHLNSSHISLAACQRLSGSFARHFFTRRSSAGGVIGASVLMGGGSVSRILTIRLAWLLPSNAFLPVAIS